MVRKKMLVLLAGSPGTGKSYLLNLLKKRFPDLFALTPDEIKECYAESLGFDSLAEKAQIEKQYVLTLLSGIGLVHVFRKTLGGLGIPL